MGFIKRYFYLLLLSCVVLTVFSGCNTGPTVPLTENDFYELKNYPTVDEYGEPKDPKKPEDLQYYVSKKVTLKLVSTPPPALTADYLGNLIKYSWTVREKVNIASNDFGKLLSIDKNGYLIIGFEENNPECFLRFGLLPDKGDEKYYLIFDDNQNYTVTYGDGVYDVLVLGTSEDDRRPHLNIKKEEIPLNYKNNRQVLGWPVYR
jgi:hypothetical protein